MVDGIDQGRQAFHQRAWGKAFALLSTADAERPLGADDLERLAAAAYLAGMVDASVDAWTRAHRDALLAGAAADYARAQGATAVEGYAIVTTPGLEITWGETHVGAVQVFEEAGFTEVSAPTKRRRVMRIET